MRTAALNDRKRMADRESGKRNAVGERLADRSGMARGWGGVES
jgi:hypothetical protein